MHHTTSAVAAGAMNGWHELAACQGMGVALFFAPAQEQPVERQYRERRAKALCARCPVRTDCLAFAAHARERFGIWGGLTGPERRRLFPALREEEAEELDGDEP